MFVNLAATVVGYYGGNVIIKKFNDADKAKAEEAHKELKEKMEAKVE